MFNKLKKAFSTFIERASRVLTSKKDLEDALEDLKYSLIESDVAFEVVEEIADSVWKSVCEGIVRDRRGLVKLMKDLVKGVFQKTPSIDIVDEAYKFKPYKIVFLGVNGVGKTTTIAKIAMMYYEKGFKPLMVAADTFRAGAQEQLRIHGERTGLPVFMGKYGADPAATAYDAVAYASKRGYDVVLIDTAGRMHVDVDLVDELKKIVRVIKPHRKILVVDALTGNDAIEQARFFNDAVSVDAVIVTKVDAYERGGVPLSIAYILGKPIIYVGVGQGYKDIKPFDVDEYISKIIPSE